jgi:hypothetical protein
VSPSDGHVPSQWVISVVFALVRVDGGLWCSVRCVLVNWDSTWINPRPFPSKSFLIHYLHETKETPEGAPSSIPHNVYHAWSSGINTSFCLMMCLQ